jgi:hypothetical protein
MELPLEPCHLGVPSGASKTISEPKVCLAQTMHLSNTISKWTGIRFHMTHVTLELNRVCPKWFLSLWYVHCESCTYLVSRLAQSLNGPKRASTWLSSPRSTIGCVQNDLWAYGTFNANRAPILHQDLHYLKIDWIELKLDPHHLEVLLGASKMILEPMVRLAQTLHLSCTDTNTISKRTETRFHMTHIT